MNRNDSDVLFQCYISARVHQRIPSKDETFRPNAGPMLDQRLWRWPNIGPDWWISRFGWVYIYYWSVNRDDSDVLFQCYDGLYVNVRAQGDIGCHVPHLYFNRNSLALISQHLPVYQFTYTINKWEIASQTTHQTRDIIPMLVQCWANVVDVGSTLM